MVSGSATADDGTVTRYVELDPGKRYHYLEFGRDGILTKYDKDMAIEKKGTFTFIEAAKVLRFRFEGDFTESTARVEVENGNKMVLISESFEGEKIRFYYWKD